MLGWRLKKTFLDAVNPGDVLVFKSGKSLPKFVPVKKIKINYGAAMCGGPPSFSFNDDKKSYLRNTPDLLCVLARDKALPEIVEKGQVSTTRALKPSP